MKFVQVLRRMVRNSNALVAAAENQQQLLNDRLREVAAGIADQSRLLNEKLEALIAGMANQSSLLNDKLGVVTESVLSQSRVLNLSSVKRSRASKPNPTFSTRSSKSLSPIRSINRGYLMIG